VQGSVTDTNDITRIFSQAKEAYGNIDILVNNAGVYKFDPVQDVTLDEFNRQFHTNVLGPIFTTAEALKHFPETGGSIINISSVVAVSPGPGTAIYSSTKGALDTLTKTLALELAPKNIRVNTVSPGLTETEGAHSAGVIGSEFANSIVATTPLGRAGQPEDIAGIVTFLASEDAAWITGQRVNASGGLN
jgi:3-oxoacyl-[acyl-carrier protein] reductase